MGLLINLLTSPSVLRKIRPFFSSHGEDGDNISGLHHGGTAQILRRHMTEFGSGWQGMKHPSFEEGLLGPESIPEKEPNLSFQWLEQGFVRHEEEDFSSHLPGYLLGATEKSPRILPFLKKNWKIATAIGIAGLWMTRPLSLFSGRDDSYNSIEGMRHGGLAGDLRKKNTEFGSGWDPLRKFAAEAGTTLEKLVHTSSFKKALSSGKHIRELGEGSFGKVSLLESKIRLGDKEHTFQFARKVVSKDDMGGLFKEVKAQRKLQDLNAPNVYGMKENRVFMEPIRGRSALGHLLEGNTLPESFINDLENFIPEMHRRGVAHMDMAKDVNRIARKATQFGEVVPHNIMLTDEGRAAVIDYGLSSRPGIPTRSEKTMQEMFGKTTYPTNAEFDMSLVASLRKNQGKMSPKAIRKIDMMSDTAVPNTVATAPAKRKNPVTAGMAAAQRSTSRKMFALAGTAGKKSRTTFGSGFSKV